MACHNQFMTNIDLTKQKIWKHSPMRGRLPCGNIGIVCHLRADRITHHERGTDGLSSGKRPSATPQAADVSCKLYTCCLAFRPPVERDAEPENNNDWLTMCAH